MSNIRGINDGENLPRELLVSLFDSIKTEPFKIPEDDGNDLMHTFFNPDKEGWLWKQGGRLFFVVFGENWLISLNLKSMGWVVWGLLDKKKSQQCFHEYCSVLGIRAGNVDGSF